MLPILSKIIEKHVANSLLKYLQENNLLYELQSAFRSGYSTETALIRITDEILFKRDNDEVTGLHGGAKPPPYRAYQNVTISINLK